MSWSEVKDVKAQVLRLWERGDLLREALAVSPRFPLRVSLKGPSSRDITDRFDEVRAWAGAFAKVAPCRVAWQEVSHRIHGRQQLPAFVWIDTPTDAVDWLGKSRDWSRFSALVAATQTAQPALLAWLEKHPHQALALADEWPRLLAVVDWMTRHPCPAIYLRQLDVPGVHSKFLETHRTVLAACFDLVLPTEQIDASKTGAAQFAARYGFLDKPHRVRLRVLDPDLAVVPGTLCPDLTLDAESFSRLDAPVQHVFITENEVNFLALPSMPRAIAVFGAGYGWESLARAQWLQTCEIHYWGDIDTHGFAILDQLRSHFTHVQSWLMDRATLDAHADFWGHEAKPQRTDLTRLTRSEQALYDDLRDNTLRPSLRLEQEHLGFQWVRDSLLGLVVCETTHQAAHHQRQSP